MSNFFDLHRHDEYSDFDGFGKAKDLVRVAKQLGYRALGISNHGNTSGLIQHYQECIDADIKPVMGVEVYFQPSFSKEKPRHHLCLYAKDLEGYKNINKIVTEANVDKFYYKPTVDFETLNKFNKGIICTSACIGGALPQAIAKGNEVLAEKLIKKFKALFGDDFYIEMQPYGLSEKGLQERVNLSLMALARKHKVKCILTSDSHYGREEDFPTYVKMHEMGKSNLDIQVTYGERYMPSEIEIAERFAKMHKKNFKDSMYIAEKLIDNMKEIYEKVEDNILDGLELQLPKDNTINAKKEMIKIIKQGLKEKGKDNKEYMDRCKEELEVISFHGFEYYFLMVHDYVMFAKNNDIEVGAGRGSACNCLIAFAIGITDVDSIKYNLDFSRFMRKDKKKLPDIDIDFETSRRQEVIDYIVDKYKGKAIQICSYGLYKTDNLLNELFKVCQVYNKEEMNEIKLYAKEYTIDGELDIESFKQDTRYKRLNRYFDDICIHFTKMYNKVRNLGTHAAGVAIVGTDILDYTAVRKRGDIYASSYDLVDLESINAIKFDVLGLKTLSELKDMREGSKCSISYDEAADEQEVYTEFGKGNTDGVFQFEKGTPKKILETIQSDCVEDVIATNAMNRPAPLMLKMPQKYAENKFNIELARSSIYYEFTEQTYGTVLYQEQVVAIAMGVGGLSVQDSFDILKMMKHTTDTSEQKKQKEMKLKFIEGAKNKGLEESEAGDIFENLIVYSFNKGHSTAYSLIAIKQMYYKIFYPAEFWFAKIRYAGNDADVYKYTILAVKQGLIAFLPHVNYSANTTMRAIDGEKVIQLGTVTLKNVGEKAAQYIEAERKKNGAFKSYDDFYDRCQNRAVTKRVIDVLQEMGALEFDKKKYEKKIVLYNSALYAR